MKVGLLYPPTHPLLHAWDTFLHALELEVVRPRLSDVEAFDLGQQSLPQEPPTVQLMLGRLLALGAVDLALLPRWAGVSADAWSEAMAELLPRRISGLPPLLAVPEGLLDRQELEQEILALGLRLRHNPSLVRRASDKTKLLWQPAKASLPLMQLAGHTSVGVIGPRSLLGEPLLTSPLCTALSELRLYPIFSHQLPLQEVRERVQRQPELNNKPPGEQECLGALSWLSSKGAVRGILFAVPARDQATRAVIQKMSQRLHKPSLILELDQPFAAQSSLESWSERLAAVSGPGRKESP